MKKINILFLIFSFLLVYGQNQNLISKEIIKIQHKHNSEEFPLFNINTSTFDNNVIKSDTLTLSIDRNQLTKILVQKPELMKISIPYNNKILKVILIKNSFLTQNFAPKTNDKKSIKYIQGVYYKGIIEGDNSSFVTFSFFKDNVIALITDKQNLNLSIMKTEGNFVLFSNGFDKELPIACGTDTFSAIKNTKQEKIVTGQKIGNEKCVQIYYEISYTDFKKHNSNTTETLDWITATHNSVSAIFANENIASLIISDVFIWQEQDPYKSLGSGYSILPFFQNYRNSYNGNLAHLITSDVTDVGGIAFLGGLCSTGGFALSSAATTDYYTIRVISHEIGHNLGSPHTHTCFWNGNNTAIDGCGPIEGDCPNPGSPDIGTLMSYCGNRALEFGEQPAAVMRNYVAGSNCLQHNCTLAQYQITTSVNNAVAGSVQGGGTYFSGSQVFLKAMANEGYVFLRWEKSIFGSNQKTYIFENSVQFYIDNNYEYHAFFQYVGIPNSGNNVTIKVISNPSTGGTTTGNGIYSQGASYSVNATANNGYTLQGWTISDYENNQTFFPPIPKITATAFYNYIFIANFTPTLSTDEVNKDRLQIYPNPTAGFIILKNKKTENLVYQIFDTSGKMVKKGTSNFNEKIDVSYLSKGNYIIYVVTRNGEMMTEKLIKN